MKTLFFLSNTEYNVGGFEGDGQPIVSGCILTIPPCRLETMGRSSTRWGLVVAMILCLLTACGSPGPQTLKRASWIVVLGAAQYNGVPSRIFRQRLDAAAALYQKGLAPQVLVTGGRQPGDLHSEGDTGRNYLIGLGLPARALYAETNSRSTYQNLQLALPWVKNQAIIVVTDQPHLPRALLLARQLGLEVQGHAVEGNYSQGYRNREWLLYLLTRLGFREAIRPAAASDAGQSNPGAAP
jgi:uncharacterized SAM-binding protein YcdF (DUF218 family)